MAVNRAAIVRYKDSIHFFVDVAEDGSEQGRWIEQPKPAEISIGVIEAIRVAARKKMSLSADKNWLTERADECVFLSF